MKLFLSIVCMIAVFVQMPGLGLARELSPGAGTLGLEDTCRTALEKNPDIQEARARINSARAVLLQAKSLWMPGISASGHAMAMDAARQPDWAPTVRATEAFNDYTASVDMRWLVFDGFARQANILAATYGVDASELSLFNTRRLILQAVSTTYYQAEIAIERMKISQRNRDFNRTLEKDAKIRFKVGLVPESHVLNFSVRAQRAETDYIAARNAYDLTCTALARLMGREDTALDAAVMPVSERSETVRDVPEFSGEVAFAEKHRPDLRAVEKQIKASDQSYRAARASYYPDVYLTSGLSYLYQDKKTTIDEEEHTGYLGMSFQWDLFTGRRRTGQIKEAFSDLEALKARRKSLLLSIRSDIRQALFTADTSFETWQRQEKTMKMTRSIRESVEKAYRAGKEPLTRLNEAQTDFIRAAGDAASARIEYQIALVNLDAASGRLALPDRGDGVQSPD